MSESFRWNTRISWLEAISSGGRISKKTKPKTVRLIELVFLHNWITRAPTLNTIQNHGLWLPMGNVILVRTGGVHRCVYVVSKPHSISIFKVNFIPLAKSLNCTYHKWAVDASTGHSCAKPLIRFCINLFTAIVHLIAYEKYSNWLIWIFSFITTSTTTNFTI